MTTILIFLMTKDGIEVMRPMLDHFSDLKDLDFIKRGATREWLRMMPDVNGGFSLCLKSG